MNNNSEESALTDLNVRVAALMKFCSRYRYAAVEDLNSLDADFEQALRVALQKPAITAIFEVVCPDGLVGITDAPIKRIEHQDDGSLTVVIDHWPRYENGQPAQEEIAEPQSAMKWAW